MTLSHLKLLFDYHYWANTKLLGPVSDLSTAEFTKPVAGSLASIRNTMVHLLSTEWGWLSRCGGEHRPAKLDPDNYPDIDTLKYDWLNVEQYMYEFLDRLSDEDLSSIAEYPGSGGAIRSMPVGELLHHVTIHGAHHRGQIAIILRELGKTPGNFDLLFYYAEMNNTAAW